MRRSILAIVALAGLTRCATIVHGPYQQVPVTSDPTGATVRVDCGTSSDGGTTPTTVRLLRKANSCTLTLTKSNYADARVVFDRLPAGAYWFNLAAGLAAGLAVGGNEAAGYGLLLVGGGGLLVDWIDGAMWKREPARVDVELELRRR